MFIGLFSVYCLNSVAKTAKTSTIVDRTLSAENIEITRYIAPGIAIHALTYDDAPLVVSRYVSRYLGRDTIRVSPAQVSRCIDVSLRP